MESNDKHIEIYLQQLQKPLQFSLAPCCRRTNPPYPFSATPVLGHYCRNSQWTPQSQRATPSSSTSSSAPQSKPLFSCGAHFGVFWNTVLGGKIPFPAWPQQHHGALLPMAPSSTMATSAPEDQCRGSLADLWGAWQRQTSHYLPPSHFLTCGPTLRDTCHHPLFPAAMKSGQA